MVTRENLILRRAQDEKDKGMSAQRAKDLDFFYPSNSRTEHVTSSRGALMPSSAQNTLSLNLVEGN